MQVQQSCCQEYAAQHAGQTGAAVADLWCTETETLFLQGLALVIL